MTKLYWERYLVILWTLLLVLSVSSPVWAAPLTQTNTPEAPLPLRPSAGEGQSIYAESCAPCHGDQGDGNGPAAGGLPNPPAAFSNPEALRNLSPRQIFQITKEGRIERGMPPWKNRLSDDAIWAVTSYLYDLSIGDAGYAHGKNTYQQACAACHGDTGRGDGPQAQGMQVPDLTQWPDWIDLSNADLAQRVVQSPVHKDVVASLPGDALEQAIAYARTLSYSSTRAPLVGNGTILGTVEMMTPGEEANFEGLEVTLLGFRGTMDPRLVLTTTVGSTNTFRFDGLSTDQDVLYLLRTTWEGAPYSTDVLVFPPGQQVITATLQVAASTEEDPGIRADQVHWFIDFDGESLVVGELISISNPGDRTYKGPEIPGRDGKRAVIRWSLPAGVTNLRLDGGQLGDRYLLIDGDLIDTLPLPPGTDVRRLLFQYQLPIEHRQAVLAHPVSLPIGFLTVFIADRGETVQAPEQAVKGDSRDVSGVPFLSYTINGAQPGETLTFRLTNITASAGQPTAATVSGSPVRTLGIVLAALLGVALLAGMVYLGRRSAPPEQLHREDILARRDALLTEIAQLDAQYEAGQVDEASYREQRDILMAEAVQLTRMLDAEREDEEG